MTANTNYTGPATSILIVKESTYGIDPGSGYTNLGVYDSSVNATLAVDTDRVNVIGARAAQVLAGKQVHVTGSIEGNFQDARLIAYALGIDSTSGTNPTIHYLNYKTAASTPLELTKLPSFTMVITRGTDSTSTDQIETYTGCCIDRCVIKTAVDALTTVNVDFIAQNVTVTSTGNQTAIFSANEVSPPQYVTMEVPSATGISQVQNWELTISNNLEPVFALGSQLVQALVVKNLDLGLTGTVMMTDEMIWAIKEVTGDSSTAYMFPSAPSQTYLAPTTTETVKLKSTNSLNGASIRELVINLNKVAFHEVSLSTKAGDLSTFDFTATVGDFLQTGWGASPSGAPITWKDTTTSAFV